jgi:hypothetical protein
MKRFLVVVSILGVVAGVARAQQAPPAQGVQASPFDGARRYVVASAKNNTLYQIDVLRVNSTVAPAPDDFRLPVIYVLDGNSLFPLVGYLTNAIVSFSRQLPAGCLPATPGRGRAVSD